MQGQPPCQSSLDDQGHVYVGQIYHVPAGSERDSGAERALSPRRRAARRVLGKKSPVRTLAAEGQRRQAEPGQPPSGHCRADMPSDSDLDRERTADRGVPRPPAPRTAETPLPVEFLLKRQRVGWLLKLSYGLPLLGEHL